MIVTPRDGAGRVRVAEAMVVLDRPARRDTGRKTAGWGKVREEIPCRRGWW